MGCSNTNKNNKLQNPSVIRETNLLSLINLLLAHIYCGTTLSNYGLIRLKNLSRKTVSIYAFNFVISLYLILHLCVQTFYSTAGESNTPQPDAARLVLSAAAGCPSRLWPPCRHHRQPCLRHRLPAS
jgi:hypothetical protein